MYLGIDLGTSSVKTVLMDEHQHVLGSHTEAQSVSRPHDAWSEQDPAAWIFGIEKGFATLRGAQPTAFAAAKGIGLSGHMHGATLLDDNDEVIRPCILWNDTRSHEEARELDTPAVRQLFGNIVFPGFTSPKVNWVARHEPDNFKRIAKVLLPKDYANLWLTGEHVAEMSDASGTGWLNVGSRDWSNELLALSGLERHHMPRLVEGSAAAGQLRPVLAERFGLSPDVVVAGGAGDNAASACGMGTVTPGAAFLSLGTSGVLFASNEAYRPNAESAVHTFCHALPDTWHQMGVILAATDALNWLASITGQSASDLTAALGAEHAAPVDTVFLPYLGGERTPHNDAAIRGAFAHLGHTSDTITLTRAVLQGVSFAFRDCQRALGDAGTQLDSAFAIGGGSRSAYWVQMLATALNLPLYTAVDGDYGASLGAARLAIMASNNVDPMSVCTAPDIAQRFDPDTSLAEAFDTQYERYRASYRALSVALRD